MMLLHLNVWLQKYTEESRSRFFRIEESFIIQCFTSFPSLEYISLLSENSSADEFEQWLLISVNVS